MTKRIIDKPFETSLADTHSVMLNTGGALRQMRIGVFREQLNKNDQQVLNDLAFGFAVNEHSSLGDARVDTYGNDHMRAIWEDMKELVLMDANGNYATLNKNDARYLSDGTKIVDDNGALISPWNNGDIMVIIPEYYGRIQSVTVGNETYLRPWFSPVPLPGGYVIPRQVVGKFKCSIVSNKLRSIPAQVPGNTRTIRAFWDLAQARSKNHGLSNLDFRNYLLQHMMSKYGYRDSQGCRNSDNTLVWGAGLDGSENTTSSSSDGFMRQKNILTGATLSLGLSDGKSVVTDSAGGTCHKVNVAGFEDPWGQYWEMCGGLCSVGTNVYCWKSNFIPNVSSNPTAATFANIPHVVLSRQTAENTTNVAMNIIQASEGQGLYMVPLSTKNGMTYNDHYWYAANGQLWLFGGRSLSGSQCGLAASASNSVWSDSSANFSARLAFYGEPTMVSASRLAELLA